MISNEMKQFELTIIHFNVVMRIVFIVWHKISSSVNHIGRQYKITKCDLLQEAIDALRKPLAVTLFRTIKPLLWSW